MRIFYGFFFSMVSDIVYKSFLALSEALKADHGFNVESRVIRDLVELMSTFDQTVRREYLQFITGSPKLPIGGTCAHAAKMFQIPR